MVPIRMFERKSIKSNTVSVSIIILFEIEIKFRLFNTYLYHFYNVVYS